MAILLDSNYWLNEINKTELSIAQLINDDTAQAKSSKSDGDTITLQDLDVIINEKRKYIIYCTSRYEEEYHKESKTEKTSILFIPREFGY